VFADKGKTICLGDAGDSPNCVLVDHPIPDFEDVIPEYCKNDTAGVPRDPDDYTSAEKRHILYYYMVYLVWTVSGRGQRAIMPACVALAIRRKYPDPLGVYTGHVYGDLYQEDNSAGSDSDDSTIPSSDNDSDNDGAAPSSDTDDDDDGAAPSSDNDDGSADDSASSIPDSDDDSVSSDPPSAYSVNDAETADQREALTNLASDEMMRMEDDCVARDQHALRCRTMEVEWSARDHVAAMDSSDGDASNNSDDEVEADLGSHDAVSQGAAKRRRISPRRANAHPSTREDGVSATEASDDEPSPDLYGSPCSVTKTLQY
jgi:hypothetical protein